MVDTDDDRIFSNAVKGAFADLLNIEYYRPPANLLDGKERMLAALNAVLDARPDFPLHAMHNDYRVTED